MLHPCCDEAVAALDADDNTMEVEMRPKYWPALAAAAIGTVIAGAAVAQGPGRMMDERGWGMWSGGMGWGMWGRGPDAMLDRIEGRLAFIKTELKINETQAPAWQELANAVRTAAKHHNERMKKLFTGEAQPKTLPERLDVQEQFLSARLDEIKQIKGSLKTLYAVLSDEQKKEADTIVIPMVGMGMQGGYRWRD
jgi:hypothetical protein